MSFCGLDYDVYISHSALDANDGWLDSFCEQFETRLRKLDPSASFTIQRRRRRREDAEQPLRSCGLLISIISPSALKFDVCRREREIFRLGTAASGGPLIGSKSRALRVTKTQCDDNLDRKLFGDAGFDFYTR